MDALRMCCQGSSSSKVSGKDQWGGGHCSLSLIAGNIDGGHLRTGTRDWVGQSLVLYQTDVGDWCHK